MTTTITITGASGFVGRALLYRLRQQAATTPVIVQAVSRQKIPDTWYVDSYTHAPAGDILVHLAESSDRGVVNASGAAHEQQAAATLEALLSKGFRRVVYASSAVLYGDTSDQPHLTADTLHVTDTYTRIKQAGELAVLQRRGGVVARLANLYGPGMSGTNVLSTILRQLSDAGPVTVADAAPVRDFLWIDDAATALAAMALSEADGVFNVGTGIGTSVRDLALTALAVAQQSHREIIATSPVQRRSHLVVNIASTRSAFGWEVSDTLHDGLAKLLQSPLNDLHA